MQASLLLETVSEFQKQLFFSMDTAAKAKGCEFWGFNLLFLKDNNNFRMFSMGK